MNIAQGRVILCMAARIAALPPYERTRRKLSKRFKRELVRVLKFAKHETLRKLHRYMISHRALMGQDEPQDHPDANKIVFDSAELLRDLQAMLSVEIPPILNAAAHDTLPDFQMVSQDVLDFLARRQDALSGIADNIAQKVREQISEGLLAGESIAEISARITATFDDIEQEQATLIADSETAAAYSFANDKASRAAGISYKRWFHGQPRVPRPDHLAIDGLVVPIDDPFPVGDPPLMYPHDENGSPEDVINCTCISIAATEEQFSVQ
jgi:hypothetical protein